MAIGEDNDFRMRGFGHALRFPAQDIFGGPASTGGREWTYPFDPANQFPGSFPTASFSPNNNQYVTTNNNNFFNFINNNNCNCPGGLSGITVSDAINSTSYPDITEIEFTGTGLIAVTPVSATKVSVEYDDTGGGGSNIKYGKITGSTARDGTTARWNYDVTFYSGGNPTGGTTTNARNLLEENNAAGLAYGYSIVGGTAGRRISGTNFFISPIPTGTFVSLEQTSNVDGTTRYWFSAPNPLTGTCT
jgi:hypothetical protein